MTQEFELSKLKCECGSGEIILKNGEYICTICGLVLERNLENGPENTERCFYDDPINKNHYERNNSLVDRVGGTIFDVKLSMFNNEKFSLFRRMDQINRRINTDPIGTQKPKQVTEKVRRKLWGIDSDYIPMGMLTKDFEKIAKHFNLADYIKQTGIKMAMIMLRNADSGTIRSMNHIEYSSRWACAICQYLLNIPNFRKEIPSDLTLGALQKYTGTDPTAIWEYYIRIKENFKFKFIHKTEKLYDPCDELDRFDVSRKQETKKIVSYLYRTNKTIFGSGRPMKSILATLNHIIVALLDSADNSKKVCETFHLTKVTLKNTIKFLLPNLKIFPLTGEKIKLVKQIREQFERNKIPIVDTITEEDLSSIYSEYTMGRCIILSENNLMLYITQIYEHQIKLPIESFLYSLRVALETMVLAETIVKHKGWLKLLHHITSARNILHSEKIREPMKSFLYFNRQLVDFVDMIENMPDIENIIRYASILKNDLTTLKLMVSRARTNIKVRLLQRFVDFDKQKWVSIDALLEELVFSKKIKSRDYDVPADYNQACDKYPHIFSKKKENGKTFYKISEPIYLIVKSYKTTHKTDDRREFINYLEKIEQLVTNERIGIHFKNIHPFFKPLDIKENVIPQ
jgi:hypothetical protein